MKPKKFYFILLGVLIISLLGTATGYWLGYQELGKQIIAIQRLHSDIILEDEKAQALQRLENQYQSLAELDSNIQAILPPTKQQAEVTAILNALAQKIGLKLDGFSFDSTSGLPGAVSQTTESKIAGILIMPVRFHTTGNYGQLQALLSEFEHQQRYMQVSDLQISRDADGNQLSFNISLGVFLKP